MPCRERYPHERSLVERFKDEPFVMLGISLDRTPEELARAIERESLNWPIIFDGGSPDYSIATEWEIRLLGTNFVIDHKGMIKDKLVFGDELTRSIEKRLRKVR